MQQKIPQKNKILHFWWFSKKCILNNILHFWWFSEKVYFEQNPPLLVVFKILHFWWFSKTENSGIFHTLTGSLDDWKWKNLKLKSWFAAKNPKKTTKSSTFGGFPKKSILNKTLHFWWFWKSSTFGGFQNPPLLVVFLDWKFILKYFFGNKKSQKTGKILNLDTLT